MENTIQKSAPALDASELALVDRYWRAANYLSVGQSTCSTIRFCASR